MDGQAAFYTRGGLDAPDERGASMVARHAAAQKEAMQDACLGALRKAVPNVANETRLMALEATNWDVDAAYLQLKAFTAGKPKSSHEAAPSSSKHHKSSRKRRADSDADGSESAGDDSDDDDDSSSSSSGDSGERRKRKKKHAREEKKEKSSGKKHKKKSSSKKSKKKSKSELKDKKVSSSNAGTAAAAAGGPITEFGKFGFIKDSDRWSKMPEFGAWLEEVKNLSLEVMPKFEEKNYFKEFCEDYNTGTLPHEKFYNIEKWHEREMERKNAERRALSRSNGGGERTAFDDEAEVKAEKERDRIKRAEDYKSSVMDRMRNSGDLENLKEQERLKERLRFAYNTGDVSTAEKIAAKLKPDDVFAMAASNNADNYGFRRR